MKEALKRLSHRLFLLLDRLGLHVLPKHYYSPVADRSWMKRHRHLWDRPLDLPPGILPDAIDQGEWLAQFEIAPIQRVLKEATERIGAFRFGPVEAAVLDGWMRAHRPERVIEFGSGSTTAIMLAASPSSQIDVYDPYASSVLTALGNVSIHRVPGQAAPLDLGLQAGDLLLIDSSHSLRVDSELHRLYLEIVPRLPAGVHIHIHDITLPYAFRGDVAKTFFDWQESALLAALLIDNDRLAVRCSLADLHLRAPSLLRETVHDYDHRRHVPLSIWIDVI